MNILDRLLLITVDDHGDHLWILYCPRRLNFHKIVSTCNRICITNRNRNKLHFGFLGCRRFPGLLFTLSFSLLCLGRNGINFSLFHFIFLPLPVLLSLGLLFVFLVFLSLSCHCICSLLFTSYLCLLERAWYTLHVCSRHIILCR